MPADRPKLYAVWCRWRRTVGRARGGRRGFVLFRSDGCVGKDDAGCDGWEEREGGVPGFCLSVF